MEQDTFYTGLYFDVSDVIGVLPLYLPTVLLFPLMSLFSFPLVSPFPADDTMDINISFVLIAAVASHAATACLVIAVTALLFPLLSLLSFIPLVSSTKLSPSKRRSDDE